MAKTPFGLRLKEVFDNATNQEIADILGVSAPAVQNYVSGRFPDGDKLLLIAKVTKCNLHWLLTGEGSRSLTTKTQPTKDRLSEMVRQIVRDEIGQKDIPVVEEPEENVEIKPIGSKDIGLAPVVARITPGEKAGDPKEEIRKTLVSDEGIEEMKRRLKPRRKKTG